MKPRRNSREIALAKEQINYCFCFDEKIFASRKSAGKRKMAIWRKTNGCAGGTT
jgi:hypothetical protein